MAFENALAGLPSLGQPKVRLPRWGPSRVGVRWILVGLLDETGLTGPPYRSDRLVQRRCKVCRCMLHVKVLSCVGPKFVPTYFGDPAGERESDYHGRFIKP